MEDFDPSSYVFRNAAKNAFQTFSSQPQSMMLRQFSLLVWFLGGLIDDPFIYTAGVVVTIIASIIVIGEIFLDKRSNIEYLQKIGFRTMSTGFFSFWFYRGFFHAGQETLDFYSLEVQIYDLSTYTIGVSALIWIATRSLSQSKWKSELNFQKIVILALQGITKSIIITAFLVAMFDRNASNDIFSNIWIPIVISYFLEPVFSYIFARMERVFSSSSMVFTDSQLPASALRSSILNNLFFVIVSMFYDDVLAVQLQEVRALYVVALIFALVYSRNQAQEYKRNPFRGSGISDFLNNSGTSMQRVNENSPANVITEALSLKLSDNSKLNLPKGTTIVPLDETKEGITSLIIGQGENLIQTSKDQLNSALIDGLTTTIIPKKEFKNITSKLSVQPLKNIDLTPLGIYSTEDLLAKVELLSGQINRWVMAAKQELTKFDMSNYSITETKEMTKVVLPGLSVVESKGVTMPKFTRVKMPGLSVLDQGKQGTLVRFFGLTVIDTKKFTFVDMPGITVFDNNKGGTMVNILGMKIGENADASMLDQLKMQLLQSADHYERMFDSEFDRLLSSKSKTAMFNLDSSGSFNPLLTSKESTISTHPSLPSSSPAYALSSAPVKDTHVLPKAKPKEEDQSSEIKKNKKKESSKFVDADFEIIDE